jgi:hypothetical protein
MMMNEQLPLEQELYEAWKATYEVCLGNAADEEALRHEGRVYERARLAYERAYDELGPRWTQEIIRDARKDAGEDI